MTSSLRKMWLCCLVASAMISLAAAAGNEYLPPNKGYSYEQPSVPFPSKPPSPVPRPGPPPRPNYIPPGPSPSPGYEPPSPGPRPTPPRPNYVPPGPSPTPGYNRPTPGPRPTIPTRPNYIPPPGPNPTEHHDHHDHHAHHDHHQHGEDHHHEPGMPFDFAYAVKENGNDYSHNANSDGDVTKGEYRVALPDGRTQIVKYTADWKNGFNAEVTYEGEAKYPEPPAGGYGRGPASTGPGQAYLPASQGQGGQGGYQY